MQAKRIYENYLTLPEGIPTVVHGDLHRSLFYRKNLYRLMKMMMKGKLWTGGGRA
jgi:hypothetical protein